MEFFDRKFWKNGYFLDSWGKRVHFLVVSCQKTAISLQFRQKTGTFLTKIWPFWKCWQKLSFFLIILIRIQNFKKSNFSAVLAKIKTFDQFWQKHDFFLAILEKLNESPCQCPLQFSRSQTHPSFSSFITRKNNFCPLTPHLSYFAQIWHSSKQPIIPPPLESIYPNGKESKNPLFTKINFLSSPANLISLSYFALWLFQKVPQKISDQNAKKSTFFKNCLTSHFLKKNIALWRSFKFWIIFFFIGHTFWTPIWLKFQYILK